MKRFIWSALLLGVGFVLATRPSGRAAESEPVETLNRFATTRIVADVELPSGAFSDIDSPEYRRELGITDRQAARMADVRAANRKLQLDSRDLARTGVRREGFDAKRRELNEARRELPQRLAGVLDVGQRQRLLEIYLQRVGYASLTTPSVAGLLELTPEQQERILECNRLMQEKGREMFKAARSDPEAIRTSMKTIRRQHDQRLRDVLTAEQVAAFQRLQGAPFKFPAAKPR